MIVVLLLLGVNFLFLFLFSQFYPPALFLRLRTRLAFLRLEISRSSQKIKEQFLEFPKRKRKHNIKHSTREHTMSRKGASSRGESSTAEQIPVYNIYQLSALGKSLQGAVQELVEETKIPDSLRNTIFSKFDQAMSDKLRSKEQVSTKVTFRGKCSTFKYVDNVYMFVLKEHAQFNAGHEQIDCGKQVRIVACDAKPKVAPLTKGKGKGRRQN